MSVRPEYRVILARDIRRNAWIVAVAVAFPAAELISAADVDVLLILAEIVVRDCAHKITTQQFIAGSKEMRHRSRGDLLSLCAGRHGKSVDMLYFCQAGSRIAIASDFGWSVWQDVSFALQSCARVGSAGSVHAREREDSWTAVCTYELDRFRAVDESVVTNDVAPAASHQHADFAILKRIVDSDR